jgi:hypothetical protein
MLLNHHDGPKQTNEETGTQAQADYQTNVDETGIEALTTKLNSIEVDKLDKIIRMLEQMENSLN